MRTAILASGGKDSTYATWWALMQGWSVEALITVKITSDDSMMFQLQNTEISGLQAESMGVKWIVVESAGVEEVEISDLEIAIRDSNLEIDAIVSGALRSDYQKTRIERMCERLGLISYSPLWHHDPLEHMSSLVEHGFDVRFVSVSAEGLDESWLGTRLTQEKLDELFRLAKQHRFNLDGEGGEFETVVLAAPHMERSISVKGETHWQGSRGTWVFSEAELVDCE